MFKVCSKYVPCIVITSSSMKRSVHITVAVKILAYVVLDILYEIENFKFYHEQ